MSNNIGPSVAGTGCQQRTMCSGAEIDPSYSNRQASLRDQGIGDLEPLTPEPGSARPHGKPLAETLELEAQERAVGPFRADLLRSI